MKEKKPEPIKTFIREELRELLGVRSAATGTPMWKIIDSALVNYFSTDIEADQAAGQVEVPVPGEQETPMNPPDKEWDLITGPFNDHGIKVSRRIVLAIKQLIRLAEGPDPRRRFLEITRSFDDDIWTRGENYVHACIRSRFSVDPNHVGNHQSDETARLQATGGDIGDPPRIDAGSRIDHLFDAVDPFADRLPGIQEAIAACHKHSDDGTYDVEAVEKELEQIDREALLVLYKNMEDRDAFMENINQTENVRVMDETGRRAVIRKGIRDHYGFPVISLFTVWES